MNRRGFFAKLLHLGVLAVASPLIEPFVPKVIVGKTVCMDLRNRGAILRKDE